MSDKRPLRPVPQKGILQIDSYVPGRSHAAPGVVPIKLSANESPLGASPKAMAAYRDMAETLAGYPDGQATALRDALGHAHGLAPERLMIGAGSDELLHLLAQTYLGEGDEAVMTQYGFLVYPIVTKGAGATPVVAKSGADYCARVDAILDAVTARTRMVFLDNPNNPTGTYLAADELARLHAGLPADVILVIDSAYAEYVTTDDYADGAALAGAAENVVMVRTFSKMGLAAVRLGWLYGPAHIVDALNRLRGPFNVSAPAQAAGVAAVKDTDFLNRLVTHNSTWRDWLQAQLQSNQLTVLPGQGNFLLVLFPQGVKGKEAGHTAAEADAALLQEGLVTRRVEAYGLPNALRISIGSAAAMEKVAAVLKTFMAGQNNV